MPIILLPASPIEFDFFVVPPCRKGDTYASFHCLILNAAKQPAFIKTDHCRFNFHFAAEEIYKFLERRNCRRDKFHVGLWAKQNSG